MALLVYVPTSLPWLLAPTFFFVRGGSKCMTAPYRAAVMNQWFNKNRGKTRRGRQGHSPIYTRLSVGNPCVITAREVRNEPAALV